MQTLFYIYNDGKNKVNLCKQSGKSYLEIKAKTKDAFFADVKFEIDRETATIKAQEALTHAMQFYQKRLQKLLRSLQGNDKRVITLTDLIKTF